MKCVRQMLKTRPAVVVCNDAAKNRPRICHLSRRRRQNIK